MRRAEGAKKAAWVRLLKSFFGEINIDDGPFIVLGQTRSLVMTQEQPTTSSMEISTPTIIYLYPYGTAPSFSGSLTLTDYLPSNGAVAVHPRIVPFIFE